MNALDQIGIRVLQSASVKTKSYAIIAQPLCLSKTSLAFPNDETVLADGSSKMTGAHESPSRGGQAVGRADACHNGKSIKPTLPFSRIPALEVFGFVAANPVVFLHYPAQTPCISWAAIRLTATRAARIPPRCSPVFMSRSRHDAPIRLLLPGAASPAIRVPVGYLPGFLARQKGSRNIRTCIPESAAIRSRVRTCATLERRRARVAKGRPGSHSRHAHRFVYCTVPFKDTIDADSR